MSYAGIYGFTGLPYTYDENKEAVLDTMLDESKPKDVRFLAMILCLWAEIITLGKAEEIMVELGIMDTDKLIKTYEELSKYL